MQKKSTRTLRRARRAAPVVLVLALACALFGSNRLSRIIMQSVFADTVYFALSGGNLTQNWSNPDLITTNNSWSGVPSITGYVGANGNQPPDTDPRTVTAPLAAESAIDVDANTRAPLTPDIYAGDGVVEFDQLANPTVALNGTNTADAPNLVLYLNTTGQTSVTITYNIRDLEGSATDNVKAVTTQYRVGAVGVPPFFDLTPYQNLAGGFVADATDAGQATRVTPVTVTLPAAALNQAEVEVRILTTNNTNDDEVIGIDDIVVTTATAAPPDLTISLSDSPDPATVGSPLNYTLTVSNIGTGNATGVTAQFTLPAGVTFNSTTVSNGFTAAQSGGVVTFSGGAINANGSANLTVIVTPTAVGTLTTGNVVVDPANAIAESNETNNTAPAITTTVAAAPPPTPTPTPGTSSVQFGAATFSVAEDAVRAALTITRSGDTTAAASVFYSTVDSPEFIGCDIVNGAALSRCDYVATLDVLTFAAGETSRTVQVSITDDGYVEGAETLGVTLTSPTGGASLGAQSSATLTINDNDAAGAANPVVASPFFVRQHYVDFLNREPEPGGLEAWLGVLNGCTNNAPTCDRIEVSASFFRSTEFQVKGYFFYRFYSVSFGSRPTVTRPTFAEFERDVKLFSARTDAEVEPRREAFIADFVARPEWTTQYGGLTNASYVDTLLQTAGVQLASRNQLISNLDAGTQTRSQVLRAIVESPEVNAREFNRAFVALQYFGYLRRDPEPAGYAAWLGVIDANPANFRQMVDGFVNSVEYRKRFGQP